ncbi:DUF7689 domain-containing protein [Paenibacillus gorillae]|uniref:DUF7689 domain-containing protein n=1 Tax=Paenibacillus gorillae TaxID=1243662 RepID=UPI003B5025AD
MFNGLKLKKGLLTVIIATTAIVGGATTAFAGITTPSSILNAELKTANNYAWLADADPSYNCLAYALGNTSSWIWPWGSSNPTSSQVDTYLSGKGYSISRAFSSTTKGDYEIVSYGTSSNITHFSKVGAARVGSTEYSNAKWGQAERLQHLGWDPYTVNGTYGAAVRKYAP